MAVMKIQWKNLLFKTILWLVTEMLLNLLGLHSIADYGEFVMGRHLAYENTRDSAIFVFFLKSPL
jgi:hypothetical protein